MIFLAPKIFSVAYNFLKKFLDEYTMSKIIIYNYGCDKWKKSLFQHVSPDIVPQCFGGNYTENGDSKCPQMVNTIHTPLHQILFLFSFNFIYLGIIADYLGRQNTQRTLCAAQGL